MQHQIVNKQRQEHSHHVAQKCRELAILNNYDPDVAYVAGLFHDIAKN